eukprot:TRINITY_DN63170_c0_g1_i1.p1 TRINITY_DN63170_c0_g1~~TRINITY_DN63170_c0_g1_i1.p1  ORF type:complete len:438 (+),score=118.17 TRINITY_DN63170_c0_g1_i1:47-1360(+)
MSRVRDDTRIEEADISMFTSLLMPGFLPSPESKDFDIYLMDKGVMPLLMQGLDALVKVVDKINQSGVDEGRRSPFNPLAWLAQFLLRNHPRHAGDNSKAVYAQFSEIADIHRGRRFLLRKWPEIERAWKAMVEEKGDGPISDVELARLELAEVPVLLRSLDARWGLHGLFSSRMPADFRGILYPRDVGTKVQLADFEAWFNEYVPRNDVIRESAFRQAELRVAEEEREAAQAAADFEARQQVKEEMLLKRAQLKEQFESITADMYINDSIARIINKGAVIQGLEQTEGGPLLYGEHIVLLLEMLSIWGCPIAESAHDEEGELPDVWNDEALTAWTKWLEQRGLFGSGPPRVDAAAVRHLVSNERFQEYLQKAYPLPEDEDDFVPMAEAVDDATGQVMQLSLDEQEAAAIQQRLDNGEEVLARVGPGTGHVAEVLPPA